MIWQFSLEVMKLSFTLNNHKHTGKCTVKIKMLYLSDKIAATDYILTILLIKFNKLESSNN